VYVGDLDDPEKWTWPNFNVADSGIVVGVSLIMWDALFGHGAKLARAKEAEKRSKQGGANAA
jgi:lipoprotein signal peptidase